MNNQYKIISKYDIMHEKVKKMYFVYMLRCKDNSIYTGITTDLERRLKEHKERGKKCAKYTQNHQAVKMEMAWQTENRIYASKLEYHIKKLEKFKKEELIKNPEIKLKEFLSEKIDTDKYKVEIKCN